MKKGDFLLVPHIPYYDTVTILEATEDFNKGYNFSFAEGEKDYAHCFPVKKVKQSTRKNSNVGAEIKRTLKCRKRFWNINKCRSEVNYILAKEEKDLLSKNALAQHFNDAVISAFDNSIAERVYENLSRNTQAYEWEYALAEGLRNIFPPSVSVETTANKNEVEHGADILVTIPGLLDMEYIIAIQVKDYSGSVNENPLKQIKKSDCLKSENTKVIDKYVFIINATKEQNEKLIELRNTNEDYNDIKLIFQDEIKDLLLQMAKGFIGNSVFGDL